MAIYPLLLAADAQGRIYDQPGLAMACAEAGQWRKPNHEELIPLPPESELFLLPGRKAVGFDLRDGKPRITEMMAVAAFAAPGHTLSSHPAYSQDEDAPTLPLFAYGAVGFAKGRLWICARKVDNDRRQVFANIRRGRIERECGRLLAAYPKNRLVSHIINNCVRRYDCPAARNFSLGRYEAPLPSSRTCNSACIGCISKQTKNSPIPVTPQCRLDFTPDPYEIAEVMTIHSEREKKRPIYSFGQGCEGDPLENADLLYESIKIFRENGGQGTINCNTNASRPDAISRLADAGLTSLRVSLNSSRPELYAKYYRPANYSFEDVCASMQCATAKGVYVSLNLLYFPGITDTSAEVAALANLCKECGVNLIQLRNLNIDPQLYLDAMQPEASIKENRPIGLAAFMQTMQAACPWLKFGYFNPYLGTRAHIAAPLRQGGKAVSK